MDRGVLIMAYRPLVQFNPTQENISSDCSIWLSARGLMPGVGNNGLITVPDFNGAAYTIANQDAMGIDNAYDIRVVAISTAGAVISYSADNVQSMSWKGCWEVSNNRLAGQRTRAGGIICPFNNFNAGYQYKKGWRPSRVH
jgi:hypothetical protein